MKRSKTPLVQLAIVCAVVIGFDTLGADDKPPRPAAWQVLDRLAGTWQVKLTVNPKEQDATQHQFTETTYWSPDRQILHTSGINGTQESHTMFTYDPRTKTYPGAFLEGNTRGTATGRWDAKNKTMTIDLQMHSGWTVRMIYRDLSERKAEATGTMFDRRGDPVAALTWSYRRIKPAPKR